MARWILMGLALSMAACSGDDDMTGDTGPTLSDEEFMCMGELGDAEVLIGEGIGGAFEELADGAQVGLEIAPQGGFGVSVSVRTTGLKGDALAFVTVRTEIDGVESASFTFEQDGEPTQQLFCQDDGRSALGAGIAVGFDKNDYTQDNLTDLDGVVADLIVEVTDERGVTATGSKTVTIEVGG